MTEKQAINETKYRIASVVLDHLLRDNKITKGEWAKLKKKLKSKYKPIPELKL